MFLLEGVVPDGSDSYCLGEVADLKEARLLAENEGYGGLEVWFEATAEEAGGRYIIGVEPPQRFEKSRSIA